MPQGLVRNNSANDPDKKPVKARSHFKPNVSVYQTVRFGEASPFYGAAVVPDDEGFSIRVNSDVDTLTLKSPLMGPVRMNKDYFFAPYRAILPKNADRFITNPLTGDDVIPEDVNCVIKLTDIRNYIHGTSSTSDYDVPGLLQRASLGTLNPSSSLTNRLSTLLGLFFTFYRRSWYFLSEGSLLRNFAFNLHQLFDGPRKSANMEPLTFDQFCEEYFSWIRRNISNFVVSVADGLETLPGVSTPSIATVTYTVYCDEIPENYNSNVISLREFVFLLQQGAVPCELGSVYLTDAGTALGDSILPFNPWADENIDASLFNAWSVEVYKSRQKQIVLEADKSRYLNFARAVAYQLACAQFYTADSVDYIYSPELWHENMLSLVGFANGSGSGPSKPNISTFTYNGIVLLYDSVSGAPIHSAVIKSLNKVVIGQDQANGFVRNAYMGSGYVSICLDFYMANLLGFNRSLKFRDYFVGSKKAPLAVGNVNVKVTVGTNQFSVVDVTQNILRQRFFNQVNRVGRTIKEYSQGIFGATPMRDPHECVLLGSTSEIIGAEETQNTGSEQRNMFSMTSRLRSESSKFAFEGSFSEFGVVVGILTFDVARPYVNNCDRENLHVDRFDMFNPFMQNIGDQEVFGSEVDMNQNDSPFGFQLRYMEYRQRVDYAAGGFHHYLPGYTFLADARNIAQADTYDIRISPDFIRSRSYELDALYEALPYFSPAGYFHFIVRHDISVDIDRPMLAAPSIL